VTVVVDHERGAVVWAREGKDAATLRAFFEELGKERCAKLLGRLAKVDVLVLDDWGLAPLRE
jgi:transposase